MISSKVRNIILNIPGKDLKNDPPVNLNINSHFRESVDLLLFSNNQKIDLSNFLILLKENYKDNYIYIFDRFKKASNIYWHNYLDLWKYRLNFLFSLNDKKITRTITEYISKRMSELIRTKSDVHLDANVEFMQYVALVKVKVKRKESLFLIRSYLLNLASYVKFESIYKILVAIIPDIFASFDQYIQSLMKNLAKNPKYFEFILFLEKKGVKFNRGIIVNYALNLIKKYSYNNKGNSIFITLINDPTIKEGVKEKYTFLDRVNFIRLLRTYEYFELEGNLFHTMKNILDIDPSLSDELCSMYTDKLYMRAVSHKLANINKLVKMFSTFPEMEPKKVLLKLSKQHHNSDVKYLLKNFPELNKYSAFL